MERQLTLALSKGRIFEETLPLLQAAGITVTEDPESSRKLILPTQAVMDAHNIRVVSIADLIGEAISRTATEESVSSLFD